MAELDSAIDNYRETGPLGSTDRRIPVNVESLYERLHGENSSIAESWTDFQMGEWVKTLGAQRPDMSLTPVGHLPQFTISVDALQGNTLN